MESFAEAKETVSPGGPVDWTFQVPVSGAFDLAQEETLRMGVNFKYFQQMVDALDIQVDSDVVLEFRGATTAILFSTSGHPDWKGLLMPLRLVDLDKVA